MQTVHLKYARSHVIVSPVLKYPDMIDTDDVEPVRGGAGLNIVGSAECSMSSVGDAIIDSKEASEPGLAEDPDGCLTPTEITWKPVQEQDVDASPTADLKTTNAHNLTGGVSEKGDQEGELDVVGIERKSPDDLCDQDDGFDDDLDIGGGPIRTPTPSPSPLRSPSPSPGSTSAASNQASSPGPPCAQSSTTNKSASPSGTPTLPNLGESVEPTGMTPPESTSSDVSPPVSPSSVSLSPSVSESKSALHGASDDTMKTDEKLAEVEGSVKVEQISEGREETVILDDTKEEERTGVGQHENAHVAIKAQSVSPVSSVSTPAESGSAKVYNDGDDYSSSSDSSDDDDSSKEGNDDSEHEHDLAPPEHGFSTGYAVGTQVQALWASGKVPSTLLHRMQMCRTPSYTLGSSFGFQFL